MNKKTVKRSPLSKHSLVAKSEGMGIDELDKFCAENGISFSELQSWRDLALFAMENSGNGEVVSAKFHEQETAKLQAELNRKDKALADNRVGYRAKNQALTKSEKAEIIEHFTSEEMSRTCCERS